MNRRSSETLPRITTVGVTTATPTVNTWNRWSRPVSRVLYVLRRDSHSSRPDVAVWLQQPTREQRGPRYRSPIWSCSEWGLPCHAALAPHAVRSYRTLSPLPRTSENAVRRSALCCTGRQLTLPRSYLALCPMEPGLSSMHLRATRLPGRLHRRLYSRRGFNPRRAACVVHQ
jgi:hypothetical protein